jgi:Protein of unknown function (DUF1579)
MKKLVAVVGLVAAVAVGRADEPPKPPAPLKEHDWLKQLAGEWETEAEMVMEPGKPTVKFTGTETARTLGGFWLVGEHKISPMGTPVTGVMTVGYDAAKKKYVGTWVCSVDGHLWHYEGTVDSAGKVLTLNTEGPDMTNPGKTCKMRDVLEVKDPDHVVLTSQMQTADGKWVQFMTMNKKRKK